jgi:hypothetical protein
MLKTLRDALFPAKEKPEPMGRTLVEPPPSTVRMGGRVFDLMAHLHWHEGLPHLDWAAVHVWLDKETADDASKDQAWSACETAWLEHLAGAAGLHVFSATQTHLVTSLDARGATDALRVIESTRREVLRVLEGVARDEGWGRHIVVLFNDDDSYYRYVSYFYPDAGEFAVSGGMYIQGGCQHFVAVLSNLHQLQPVIAHETTHALLAHWPIPAWLNEGLAVNTERRLFPPMVDPRSSHATPHLMHKRHVRFWTAELAQEFWSGESFLRPDEGNELSYDLARIFVEQFAKDWPGFRAFVATAVADDAGAAAAREHLHLDLGHALAALLESDSPQAFAPDPARWTTPPQRGGF